MGATGLFGELQSSLDTIWEVAPRQQGILSVLRERILSFGRSLLAFALAVLIGLGALAIEALRNVVGGRRGAGAG